MINTAQQTGDWETRERVEKLLLLLPRGVLRAPLPPEPQEQPSRRARNEEAYTMQRFPKFLQSDWAELEEGRKLPHAETPVGKASKIIGALVSQMTSFGAAPTTEATVNAITGMLRNQR